MQGKNEFIEKEFYPEFPQYLEGLYGAPLPAPTFMSWCLWRRGITSATCAHLSGEELPSLLPAPAGKSRQKKLHVAHTILSQQFCFNFFN